MVFAGLDTTELLSKAKEDAGSFLLIALTLFVGGISGFIVQIMVLRYLEHHMEDALWIQENKKMVAFTIGVFSTFFVTIAILSTTSVFQNIAWVVAPIAVTIVYLSKKSIQNMVEYFFMIFEGKIQNSSFLKIENPLVRINAMGKFQARNSRKSYFKTIDGGEIIMTNHDIFEAVIKNYTHSLVRKISIEVTIPHKSDLTLFESSVKEFLSKNPKILSPYPIETLLLSMEEGHLHFSITFWIARDMVNPYKIKNELSKALLTKLREEHFIPHYPYRDSRYTYSS